MIDSATTALLSTHDPRKLSEGQWKRYSGLVKSWLCHQGLVEICTICSTGTWEDFGTVFNRPGENKEVVMNYVTMPIIAQCILLEKDLQVLLEFLEVMRSVTRPV
jgi:hypothetical protein